MIDNVKKTRIRQATDALSKETGLHCVTIVFDKADHGLVLEEISGDRGAAEICERAFRVLTQYETFKARKNGVRLQSGIVLPGQVVRSK